jgi:hypothetical protein
MSSQRFFTDPSRAQICIGLDGEHVARAIAIRDGRPADMALHPRRDPRQDCSVVVAVPIKA